MLARILTGCLAWASVLGAANLFWAGLYHFSDNPDSLAVFVVLGGSVMSICHIRTLPFIKGSTPGLFSKVLGDANPPIAARSAVRPVDVSELVGWAAILVCAYLYASLWGGVQALYVGGLPLVAILGTGLIFLIAAATIGRSLVVAHGFLGAFREDLRALGRVPEKLTAVLLAYGYVVLLYAALYRILSIRNPSAFDRRLDDFVDAVYFSAITIATVGYGDITPRVAHAKLLVISEVLLGILLLVFALAIVMARPPKAPV